MVSEIYNIKEGKDNIRDGLPKAVEGEFKEEVLSEIHEKTKGGLAMSIEMLGEVKKNDE